MRNPIEIFHDCVKPAFGMFRRVNICCCPSMELDLSLLTIFRPDFIRSNALKTIGKSIGPQISIGRREAL